MTPEEVVRGELAAWGRLNLEEIMGYYTLDAVWDNVPLGPASGYDQIRKLPRSSWIGSPFSTLKSLTGSRLLSHRLCEL